LPSNIKQKNDEGDYPSNLFQSYGPAGEIYNKNNKGNNEDQNENISIDDIVMEDEENEQSFINFKKHN